MHTLENKTCPFCHAEYGAVAAIDEPRSEDRAADASLADTREETITEEKPPEVAPLEKKITIQSQKGSFKIWKNS